MNDTLIEVIQEQVIPQLERANAQLDALVKSAVESGSPELGAHIMVAKMNLEKGLHTLAAEEASFIFDNMVVEGQ